MQDGKLERSLKALHQSLELSSKLEEASGDVDVLGAIGELYSDVGDLEKAGDVCKPLWIFLIFFIGLVSCCGWQLKSLADLESNPEYAEMQLCSL